jgi:Zn-dependent M28 family amino/carboxypeptidase
MMATMSALLILLLTGDGPTTVEPALASIVEARLTRHIGELASPSYQGRGAGSEGAAKAAQYLREQFKAIGLEPAGTSGFDQAFEAGGQKLKNVIGRLEGDDETLRSEYVVLGAHYDHLGVIDGVMYPGADDNASGCAALIEVARAFTLGDRPKRSLLFIAFDSEEHGLRGSKHFVKEPTVPRPKIVAMINLDMVSRGDTDTLQVCGAALTAEMKAMAEHVAPDVGLKLRYEFEEKWRHASDHGPFGDAGIPFLYFGVEDHPDYHKPSDTADKANGKKIERIARLTYLTAREVADATTAPTMKKP